MKDGERQNFGAPRSSFLLKWASKNLKFFSTYKNVSYKNDILGISLMLITSY